MARQTGERYVCEKCGATIVYEKGRPCTGADKHSEICCGSQMKAAGKGTSAGTR